MRPYISRARLYRSTQIIIYTWREYCVMILLLVRFDVSVKHDFENSLTISDHMSIRKYKTKWSGEKNCLTSNILFVPCCSWYDDMLEMKNNTLIFAFLVRNWWGENMTDHETNESTESKQNIIIVSVFRWDDYNFWSTSS